MHTKLPNGNKITIDKLLLDKAITLRGRDMITDLIVFNMLEFIVILGMDFHSRYGAEIDYRKKKVRFHLDDGRKFTFDDGGMLV